MIQWFGDHPWTRADMRRVEKPIGKKCIFCKRKITKWDKGYVLVHKRGSSKQATHRSCFEATLYPPGLLDLVGISI